MIRRFSTYALGTYLTLILGSLIGVLIKSLIAREMDKDAFGLYTYYISLYIVGSNILSFGLPDILTKVTAEEKPYSTDFNRFGIALTMILTIVFSVVAVLTWGVIDRVYSLTLLVLGPATLMPVATSVFRGELAVKRESSYRLLRRIAELFFIALLIILPFQATKTLPVYGVLASWYLATFYLLFLMWRRRLFITPGRFVRILREPWLHTHVLFSASLWLASVVTIVGSQSDSLVVGNYLGYVQLGEYGAAVLFYGLLAQILEVLGNVYVTVFPRGNNKEIATYRAIISMNGLVVPLMGIGTLLCISFLSPLLLSDKYKLVVPLFMVLSFSFIFRSLELANRALAVSINQPQINMKSALITIAVYVPALWLLVARIGLFGAALSDMFFWGTYTLMQIYFLKPHLPEHAACSARTAILGFAIYGAAIAVCFVVSHPILRFVAPIATYVLLGHAANLWDLRFVLKIARQLTAQFWKPFYRRQSA